MDSIQIFNSLDFSKMSDYDMATGRRNLELKLSRLDSLLKRPSDMLKIQLDSEESAEVFQLR